MSDQVKVTAEQLRAKAAEIKARTERERAGGTTSLAQPELDPFTPVTVSAICRCGATFTYQTFTAAKFGRSICDRCLEREEEAEQAKQRQAEAEATEARRAARNVELLDLLAGAGVNTAEHGRSTLETWDARASGPEPVAAAREFLRATRTAGRHDAVPGLYLHGPTGTGKTHLAVGVIRELLSDPAWPPAGIVFDHAAELVARIQATYGGKGDTFAELERRFNARVWVLDDLGTERATDDVALHLTLIFTRRALRPTLVTSNLSPRDMDTERPELGRVMSRLGPAYFQYAKVGGEDRRLRRSAA
jgi:DNA replication protein DnaC